MPQTPDTDFAPGDDLTGTTGLPAHLADTTDVHGISNTALLAYLADLLAHELDTTNVHGIADTSLLDPTAAIATHAADTTSVHGITDTSALETTTGAQTKVDTHSADTTSVHGISDTTALETTSGATTKVLDHNATTTSVHGISNTANLETTTGAQTKADAAAAASVAKTVADAKGDLIVATAADTFARLAVGTNAQEPVADSTHASGIRWITPRTIDPKSPAYNALGDNSTDDSAALQSAATAAASAGADMFLPAGTFICEDLDLVANNVLRGVGTLKHKASSSSHCVDASGDNITVEGIKIDGNSPNIATAGLAALIVTGSHITVRGVEVYDAKHAAIRLFPPGDHILVEGCRVWANNAATSSSHHAVFLDEEAGSILFDIIVQGCFISDSGNGTISGRAAGLTVANNNCRDNAGGFGLYTDEALGLGHQRNLVIGNQILNSGNTGMHLGGQGVVSAIGNMIDSPVTHGIEIASDPLGTPSAESHFLLAGNHIKNPGTESGITVANFDNGVISGNLIEGGEQHGIEIADSSVISITGNTCRENDIFGISVAGSEHITISGNTVIENNSRGIAVIDGCDTVLVANNIVEDNTTSQMRTSGSATNVTFDGNMTSATVPFSLTASGTCHVHHTGAGTPETVVACDIGSTWRRTDGAVGTSFYVKESGTGATGWTPVSTSPYRTIKSEAFMLNDTTTAAVWAPTGNAAQTNVANAIATGLRAFYLDPADWALAGRTTSYNLRATLFPNATATGVTITAGLYPVSAIVGAADTLSYTVGTVTTGSTAAFVTPAASTRATVLSGDFTAPAAGYYILAVASSGTFTADSRVQIDMALRVHNT